MAIATPCLTPKIAWLLPQKEARHPCSKKLKKLLTGGFRFEIFASHTVNINNSMRTKTLLLMAALTIAGVASSFAQVYSQNIVGYVTTPVTKSVYKMIANPLNTTNNTIAGVLTHAA